MRLTRAHWALLWGWAPVAVLFMVLLMAAHGGPLGQSAGVALRLVFVAAALGVWVHRYCMRHPWPQPMHPRFLLVHAGGAGLYAAAFLALNLVVASLWQGRLAWSLGPGAVPYLFLGVWLYVAVAGVSYATRATARAAELEAQWARAQLATLQGQLHPHFLFNALHTVVQLIDLDPRRAVRAAEQLGAALRESIDEQRPQRTVREELAFVRRYQDLEALRFGERLQFIEAVDADAMSALIPTFALQTLIENAVRHGAAPVTGTTTIAARVTRRGSAVFLEVHDDGAGAEVQPREGGGLERLRRQLAVLHGDQGTLAIDTAPREGFRAILSLPFVTVGDEP